MEYWYDSRHTGALRVIDHRRGRLFGGDSSEVFWTASVRRVDDKTIEVDFVDKRTHHGRRIMHAVYKDRRNRLHWPDGNVWRRLRVDPRTLIEHLPSDKT